MLDVEVGFLPRQVFRHVHFLQPRLAAPPAETDQEIGGGGERVGDAVDQVAAAVAVEVDGVLEIVGGGELHAAEFAGPIADHVLHALVAALHDAQGVEQLLAEEFRTAAVIGERRQRLQDAEISEIAAEVAFQPPERGQHRRRHAVLLFDLGEQRGVLLHLLLAVRDARAADHAVGELQEGLLEHGLALVAPDDAGIEHQVGRGGRQDLRRNALLQRLGFELRQPRLEAAGVAAARGHGRARHRDREHGDAEQADRQSQSRLAHEAWESRVLAVGSNVPETGPGSRPISAKH